MIEFLKKKKTGETRIPQELFDDLRLFIEENYEPEDDTEYYYGSALGSAMSVSDSGAEETYYSESSSNVMEAPELFSESLAPEDFDLLIGSAEPAPKSGSRSTGSLARSEVLKRRSTSSLDELISGIGLTFQQELLRQIDKKGFKDSEVYKRANIDRKHFSKIRCNANYKPSKLTALALAIALELNLDETTDLISRAGLALSPSDLTDLIIKYCIINRIYDINIVNELLFEHDQQLIGC